MDEVKRKRLQKEIIQNLKEKGLYQDSFDHIINIYVDMLIQRDELEKQISDHKGEPASMEILADTQNKLNEDIGSYEKALCL
jgi:hypothetical protein